MMTDNAQYWENKNFAYRTFKLIMNRRNIKIWEMKKWPKRSQETRRKLKGYARKIRA